MKIENVVNRLVLKPQLIDMTYKYNNQVELSGWLLKKPKFIKHDKKGTESCALSLYQVNNTNGMIKIDMFYCMVYVKDLIEQLKKVDKVLFLATMGKVKHHFKYGDYSHITEIKTLSQLNIPLADE